MNNPILQSFMESGWVGQGILLILFAGSIYSWTIIFYKFSLLRKVRQATDAFLERFSRTKQGAFSLSSTNLSSEIDPVYTVYKKGCTELAALVGETGPPPRIRPENWERLEENLQRTADIQTRYLEKGLIFLATAASTGPLLGILGTGYGVLIAFQGMGRYGSATIDAVAPGISEALITTVFGLIVAIPALIAYNHFKHFINNFSLRLDNFISDFIARACSENQTTEKRDKKKPKK